MIIKFLCFFLLTWLIFSTWYRISNGEGLTRSVTTPSSTRQEKVIIGISISSKRLDSPQAGDCEIMKPGSPGLKWKKEIRLPFGLR